MQCPSCGLQIDQQNLERCPRCGRMLSDPAAQNVSGGAPYGGGQQGDSQQAGGYGSPPTPENPYGVYGGSMPPSGYSQPTAPSYPQPSYPQPGYPQSPLASQPARKSHMGLIVGVIALVVVVLAACTGGTLFTIHSLGQTGTTAHSGTPAGTPTLSASKVYSNTFASNADGWLQDLGHCYLGNDGYHVADGYYCLAPVAEQDNIDMTVKVQLVGGSMDDGYGITFRQQDKDNLYAFMITGSGYWVFFRCVKADCTTPVYFTADSAIKTGLDTANTLEVRATGPHFVFFVNGVNVGSFDDTTFTFGKIGFIASGGSPGSANCAFTDLVITRPD